MTNSPLSIRPANSDDLPAIVGFIRGLAEFEGLTHAVDLRESDLLAHLFGERPYADVLLATWDGAPAGFALYFFSYSTFRARPGIYLEDLYVPPERRRHGIGRALLKRVAETAVEHGCARLEWSVLDWNQNAIDFYRSLGASPLADWTMMRLTDGALRDFAAK